MSSLGSPSTLFLAKKEAYEIERSLRFDGDHGTSYLEETAGTPTNNKIWTYSVWIKRTKYTSDQAILVGFSNGGSFDQILFSASSGRDQNLFMQFNNSGTYGQFTSTQYFKDSSAWGHLVIKADTTAGTNGVTVYWNNKEVTGTWNTTLAQDATFHSLNQSGDKFRIGHLDSGVAGHYLNAYVAEANFIDGTALLPSSFGATDPITGQWNPKKYGGGYGNNGFYLNFSDNSGTTATTLGKDSSGNGNNFTLTNFNTHDSLIDTPTNNFCVLNPVFNHHNRGEIRLMEGGLKGDNNGSGDDLCHGTFGIKSGKWYFEATGSSVQTQSHFVGVQTSDAPEIQGGMYRNNGYIVNYSGTLTTGNGTYDSGDVIGVAIDADAGKVYFAKNNTYINSGNPSTGANASFTYTPSSTDHILPALMFDNISHTVIWYINFGQDSSFAGFKTAQGNTDSGGKGDFYYAPPSGFLALCSANLPDPTIKLPNKHFDILTWTGTAASHTLTGLNFQPDWFWAKSRSQAYHHTLIDSVRGVDRQVWSNRTNAEQTNASFLTSFNSNGLTLGDNSSGTGGTNTNGHTYVGWNWNAGDTDGKTYTVKVVSDSGNKYRFDDFGTSAVTLDLAEGGTYIFDQSDSSNSGHPLRFYTAADKTGGEYTTGVTTAGTPGSSGAYTQIVVAASAPTLFYQCSVHAGMGGQANTNSTLGSSNFDGTIQTTVKVNATAGFSIISYTGTGSDGTLGHGLGVAPSIYIVKRRNSAKDWYVQIGNLSEIDLGRFLKLNATDSINFASDVFAATADTSTVLNTKSDSATNGSSDTYIAYCFSEVEGYSKFGKYTGNGAGDGTFVYTGFKVQFLIIKKTNAAEHWIIADTKRNSQSGRESPADSYLLPSATNAESTGIIYDLNSNGFKFRSNSQNTSGHTYVYFAFAESPFKNARAR